MEYRKKCIKINLVEIQIKRRRIIVLLNIKEIIHVNKLKKFYKMFSTVENANYDAIRCQEW